METTNPPPVHDSPLSPEGKGGQSTVAPSVQAILWPRSVQIVLGMLAGMVVVVILFQTLGTTRPLTIQQVNIRASTPIDLNQAGREDLLLLPGIGPALAQRILDHRQEFGPFQRIEDLRSIPGIGPITLGHLRPLAFVQLGENSSQDSFPSLNPTKKTKRVPGKSKKEIELVGRVIDINQAGTADLQKLPGIGPKLAQRILDQREQKGPFRSAQDLRKVAGIGPKTLEKIRPYISLGAEDLADAR